MAPRNERIGPQPEPGWWAGRTRGESGVWADPGPCHFATRDAAAAHLDRLSIEPGEYAVLAHERRAVDDTEARFLVEDVFVLTEGGYLWTERRGPIRISYGSPGGFG